MVRLSHYRISCKTHYGLLNNPVSSAVLSRCGRAAGNIGMTVTVMNDSVTAESKAVHPPLEYVPKNCERHNPLAVERNSDHEELNLYFRQSSISNPA